MKKLLVSLAFFLLFFFLKSCTNPFAPALSEGDSQGTTLGDQRTVEGVFQNLRFSYIYKDTLTYGRLLADDFIFSYYNFDVNADRSWGRDEDVRATAGLFRSVDNLDLMWNGIVTGIGDSLVMDVRRSFLLTIVYSPGDVTTGQGDVILRLKRNSPDEEWKIQRWQDVSDF
jgi:hypothetical protein